MTSPVPDLKARLRRRERMFAGWASYSNPSTAETFARAGFDFMVIDMEHSTINQEQAQRIIAASQSEGVPCIPRPVSHSNDHLKPLLESGADGALFPMVESDGVPGQTQQPTVLDASRSAIEACAHAGVSCGTQLSGSDARGATELFTMGHAYAILGSDLRSMPAYQRTSSVNEPEDLLEMLAVLERSEEQRKFCAAVLAPPAS